MNDLDFSLIGKRIREVRTKKQLTQDYLAEYADVNVSHISNIENNRVKVSLSLLVNICNALDVSIDYILQHEYQDPSQGIETELVRTINDMPKEKQEMLLRIAKVL